MSGEKLVENYTTSFVVVQLIDGKISLISYAFCDTSDGQLEYQRKSDLRIHKPQWRMI
jgi:hypothetical protein